MEKKTFSCDFCFKKFTRCSSLKRHIRTLHPLVSQHCEKNSSFTPVKSSFKCDMCEKRFSRPKNVRRHKKRVHKVFSVKPACNQFICNRCEKGFSTGSKLKRHEISHHKMYSSSGCRLYAIKDIGVAHLIEASIKLECSIETTARGLILYHHFLRCVDENLYDKSMVAAVALSLSGRINEQIIDTNGLLCVFYSIVNDTTEVLNAEEIAFLLLKKSLVTIDYLMQRMLEFNLNHRLAHQYIVPFLALLFERSKNIAEFRKEISNTCIRFLSDFYTTGNCLNYQPEHIAVACIDLSLYVHGLINDLFLTPVWYQGFCSNITVDRVKHIKADMMHLYQGSKPGPAIIKDVDKKM